MSIKKLSLMFFILLLLGGYFYFYEIKRKGSLKEIEEAAKKVFPLEKENIVGLRLKNGDTTIICRKDNGRWDLQVPVQAEADPTTIETVLDSLLGLSRDRVVEESPADLSPYGLKDTDIKVVLKSNKAKEKTQTLYLGDKNPTGSFLYVRKDSSPEIFLVSSSLKTDLSKGVYDFRDKTVLRIDPKDVKRVEFIGNGQEIRCELDETQKWILVEPIKYRANGEKLREFLDKAHGLKIKEFVEEDPKELAKYGLDRPSQELAIWSKDDESSPERLLLGRKDEEKRGIYAKHHDKKNVFLLEEVLLTYLPKGPADLRDPFLLHFDPQDVTKLSLRYPEENIVCVRGKDRIWQLQSPIEVKADGQELANLLNDLKDLQVKEFVSDAPEGLQEYGLEVAQKSYIIWEEDQKTPTVLLLGQENSSRGGFYAKIKDQPHIFLVGQEDVEKITKKSFDLRDKSLLAFEVSEIDRIRLRYPDREILLKKEGDDWTLLEPQEGKANYVKVLDLLWEMNGLKFKDIASEEGNVLPEYGLDKPQLQISLWKGKEDPWDTLLVGAATPDEKYLFAKTASHRTIYKIQPDLLKSIPQKPVDLQ